MGNLENNSNLVDIKVDRSWLFETKRNFSKRWNIDLQDNKFYERCIELVEHIIENCQSFKNLSHKIHQLAGKVDTKKEISINIGVMENFQKSLNGSKIKFVDTSLYDLLCELSNDTNFIKFIEILELIFNESLNSENKDFINKFNDIAFISNKPVRLMYDDGYKFYPSGVELFDKKLIDDVLEFLKDYKEAHREFAEALSYFVKKSTSYSDIANKIRVALELFLKEYFCNDKSLEKQIQILGGYLKNNNICKEIANMFHGLVNTYTDLNNQIVKHKQVNKEYKMQKSEVEFLFYMVGNFVKFIIEAKSENQ
ncbi:MULTISPECIES: hypothetical protein [unclassified Campylobacter]|uniref:hypothetical protein n=1 Tax=unclassified Campylobacter TaxID=2593542 RepID=UPI0022E9A662|nr:MULTISPECIES: hypothetical protein [unclassified Campylobacter]MDA3079130.1 hypothetical protein [Campylobacter sp. CS_NA2]MDA3080567.1 hypothetical protein [Campylobacter sp. CS_NA1]MDA3085228.1 hypothetical protein [Campylobacter sp. CS_ED1]MDA3090005.1 hypothetical protein [Campylobacter sp. CS_ED2]WBR51452.1 hypothetical protein PF026_01025 [Campylobacter sp. CS_NA3]